MQISKLVMNIAVMTATALVAISASASDTGTSCNARSSASILDKTANKTAKQSGSKTPVKPGGKGSGKQ